MKAFWFKALLADNGWLENVYVVLDDQGAVVRVTKEKVDASIKVEKVEGAALPGMINAHSHAFQYAMAGLAETVGSGQNTDDFWTWREAMYSLALNITPDQAEAIAAQVYAEMLRCGTTAVVEFHYLHHDGAGQPYEVFAEMAERHIAAAETAGIRLCLVPVYYKNSSFDTPHTERQRRFVFGGVDDYLRLCEAVAERCKKTRDFTQGFGIHSLRAAGTTDALRILNMPTTAPIHLHVAEQQKEVDDCKRAWGLRPVEWLLEKAELSGHHALVHATHMTKDETRRLAATGATAVLCPSTEGNLGDGFFSFQDYCEADGAMAIGSDSQINLNPFEELRWLDYGARLRHEKRNLLCKTAQDESGRVLLARAWAGGRAASGQKGGSYFAVGDSFDAVVVDLEKPVFAAKALTKIASILVYAGEPSLLKGTIRAGEWLVKDGEHCRQAAIAARYRQAVTLLNG